MKIKNEDEFRTYCSTYRKKTLKESTINGYIDSMSSLLENIPKLHTLSTIILSQENINDVLKKVKAERKRYDDAENSKKNEPDGRILKDGSCGLSAYHGFCKFKKINQPVGEKNPKRISTLKEDYTRSDEVKKWVLKEASGICECCRIDAPFKDKNGNDFLEVHHVKRLADGGTDLVSNAIAICPNCHRELHLGENGTNKTEELYENISRLERE